MFSPKRLYKEPVSGEEAENLKAITETYRILHDFIDTVIPVRKSGDGYTVQDGIERVKAALLAEVPYVPVNLV